MIAMIRSSRSRATTGWHKVIVGLNDKTIWHEPGNHTEENHSVVVIGIDTKALVVHLNVSGIKDGRDEQLALAAFEKAMGRQRQLCRRHQVIAQTGATGKGIQ
jgi:hypothetical protein